MKSCSGRHGLQESAYVRNDYDYLYYCPSVELSTEASRKIITSWRRVPFGMTSIQDLCANMDPTSRNK